MDFNTALNLKTSLSSDFISVKKKVLTTISLVSAAPAHALTIAPLLSEQLNGIGIGRKSGGENFIKIYTKTKTNLSAAKLAGYLGIDHTALLIQETGLIKPKSLQRRVRPPFPGLSAGHYQITAGTLGCFVRDQKNKVYILSNNHVLADTNRGFYGDPILQPGRLDKGRRPHDNIAKLTHYVPVEHSLPNSMDAAIALVDTDIQPVFLLNNRVAVNGQSAPDYQMRVEKFGRTTGHTKGKITTRNLDIKVDFDGVEIEFQDQFEVKGNRGTMFCDGGDSGSLIFESGTGLAVGLLFAGADDGTTFASPINEVLDAFSVSIC